MNELTLNSHYGLNREPIDDFKHRFFDDWDNAEWVRFYNYILRCVRNYLRNGLTKQENKVLSFKKLQNETNSVFVDVMNEEFNEFNKKYFFNDLRLEIEKIVGVHSNTGKLITDHRILSKWVKIFCRFKNYELKKGKSNKFTWFMIEDRSGDGEDNLQVSL